MPGIVGEVSEALIRQAKQAEKSVVRAAEKNAKKVARQTARGVQTPAARLMENKNTIKEMFPGNDLSNAVYTSDKGIFHAGEETVAAEENYFRKGSTGTARKNRRITRKNGEFSAPEPSVHTNAEALPPGSKDPNWVPYESPPQKTATNSGPTKDAIENDKKQSWLTKNRIPQKAAAIGGTAWLVSSMSGAKGQMSNKELYGQSTPYGG